MASVGAAETLHVNEVRLVGKVSGAAEQRHLPSGDAITVLRLAVRRPVAPGGPAGPLVDTVDCVVWRPAVQRTAAAWAAGDTVEVRGMLRRRFWRSPAGTQSRCEVEVVSGHRLRPAATATRPARRGAAASASDGTERA